MSSTSSGDSRAERASNSLTSQSKIAVTPLKKKMKAASLLHQIFSGNGQLNGLVYRQLKVMVTSLFCHNGYFIFVGSRRIKIKLCFKIVKVCNTSFGVQHQGKRDVERHLNGSEHKKNVKVTEKCQPMTNFFAGDSDQHKVTNAEILYTCYILEYNLPFEATAHAGPLFRKMFPDSKIALKYGCAATKTASTVNYTLALEMLTPVVEYLTLELKAFTPWLSASSTSTGTEWQPNFDTCAWCLIP